MCFDLTHALVATIRILCTSGTAVVPVPTSSSAEQQHSSSRAAAAAAADRVVKALRRGQVRDAEEEEQRHQQHGVNADTTRLHGVRPTLNPSLDSNDVSRLLTLGQGRKTCSSKRRGTWRIRPASPLFRGS